MADGHGVHPLLDGRRATRGLKAWTAALVIATFVLTLVGTFLTRSGILASVHSFTESGIGPWFLAAILLALAGSLSLLVWRLPQLTGGGRPSGLLSRESAFLFNNVLFLGLTFAVLFGTLLPLLSPCHERRDDLRGTCRGSIGSRSRSSSRCSS